MPSISVKSLFCARMLLTVFIASLAMSGQAVAADIRKLTAGPHDKGDIIIVSGELSLGDEERFKSIAMQTPRAIVVFDSPGGNLNAGLEIGRAIRLSRFLTLAPDGAICASACALAWLGGQGIFMADTAKVGFHAAYSKADPLLAPTGPGNALVGAYLNQLGLTQSAIVYITMASPTSMTWLSPADAYRLGINVQRFNLADIGSSGSGYQPPASTAPSVPTPSVSGPPIPTGPTAPSTSLPLADRALLAVSQYAENWSRPNDFAVNYLATIYAEDIIYDGKPMKRSAAIEDQRKYALRWPERTMKPRKETAKAVCDQDARMCTVDVVVDWSAKSVALDALSVGSSTWHLKIKMLDVGHTVVEESSSVLSRTKTKLSQSLSPSGSLQRYTPDDMAVSVVSAELLSQHCGTQVDPLKVQSGIASRGYRPSDFERGGQWEALKQVKREKVIGRLRSDGLELACSQYRANVAVAFPGSM